MTSFPNDYKGIIGKNACLFERLKDQSKKEHFESWEKFIPRLALPQPNLSFNELPFRFFLSEQVNSKTRYVLALVRESDSPRNPGPLLANS